MSLHVVACLHDQTKGVVTLESDKRDFSQAISELQSAEARNVAISAAAAKGMPDPRIGGNVDTYPVDATGALVENAVTQKVAAYRAEVPVTRRLV